MNLTAHGDADAVVRRLILDALALDRELPDVSSMVDLGSGAGFPGLPIAIMHPERLVTLVDSRERRHHFQRAAARELGIANVVLRLGRAEELTPEPQPLVTAQAMTKPSQAVVWMLPWVEPGGLLAVPLSAGQSPPGQLEGLGEVSVSHYAVPLGGPRRKLWIARKATPGVIRSAGLPRPSKASPNCPRHESSPVSVSLGANRQSRAPGSGGVPLPKGR